MTFSPKTNLGTIVPPGHRRVPRLSDSNYTPYCGFNDITFVTVVLLEGELYSIKAGTPIGDPININIPCSVGRVHVGVPRWKKHTSRFSPQKITGIIYQKQMKSSAWRYVSYVVWLAYTNGELSMVSTLHSQYAQRKCNRAHTFKTLDNKSLLSCRYQVLITVITDITKLSRTLQNHHGHYRTCFFRGSMLPVHQKLCNWS